jgi:NADH-quinone oxidoreductase subunit G
VVASDLQEEAPVWWLRVKQAADRGAKLIVLNPRPTKLDKFASHIIRYSYGAEAAALLAMVNSLSAKRPDLPEDVHNLARSEELKTAAKTFSTAENGIIIYGAEGLGLEGSQSLAQACTNLLIVTGHTGRANNGLIGVWQRANDQGAWDMGFRPVGDLHATMEAARALYVVAADPAGDNPSMFEASNFLVVQDLFLTDTAKLADVLLPAQAFVEREGTYTSGERRVQRFYPAIPKRADCKSDFAIAGQIGRVLGFDLEPRFASKVMARIAAEVPDYAGLSYIMLAKVSEQWPVVGRGDLYYGGTTYENKQGLGVQLAPGAQRGDVISLAWEQPVVDKPIVDGLWAVPVTRLYDRGQTVTPSKLLSERIPQPYVVLHPVDARPLNLRPGNTVQVSLNGTVTLVALQIDRDVPEGFVLVPRSLGMPIFAPTAVEIRVSEPVVA